MRHLVTKKGGVQKWTKLCYIIKNGPYTRYVPKSNAFFLQFIICALLDIFIYMCDITKRHNYKTDKGK
jgi:hypothetical protein